MTKTGLRSGVHLIHRRVSYRSELREYCSDMEDFWLISIFSASRSKPMQAIVISSDSEGDGPSAGSGKSGWVDTAFKCFLIWFEACHRYRSRTRFRPKEEFEETQLDEEPDSILDDISSAVSGAQDDSIMGPDSEEEEEEVNDILAEDWYSAIHLFCVYLTIISKLWYLPCSFVQNIFLFCCYFKSNHVRVRRDSICT